MADHEEQVATAPSVEQGGDDQAVTTTSTDVAAPTGKKVVKKIVRKKKRPARVQIDSTEITSEPPPQTGTTFNIWYNKWAGGDREAYQQTKARGRCNIATDSGFTRADSQHGSFFCLHFARGQCPKGQDCDYLHRLPGTYDLFSPNVDCFGREKFSDYRDDMGGVGSFMRQNRTIYVGRIHVTDDIEEIVARHFAEWGSIERIRVLNSRGVGFITYTNEANAQFAREAMAHQSLDHDEVLNVRWATADPNPMAQAREARRIEEQAAEAIRRALPAEFVAEIEGKDPEARKRRKIESSYGLDGYEAPDEVHFARGANAVNPLGRQGREVEYHAPPMIENGEPSVENATPRQPEAVAEQVTGIFSGSTLAALNKAKVSVAAKPKAAAAAGPLVGYDSDSDDE
ncbi:pre-mRNA-splicing factor CWC2 [Purpureocillium lilacinum]|uniref:Pre-mRNA-splicing factor CWC2 n=1 Tax=Purpureocillium lilacinum TaxID=33203 RepID=A0A179H7Q2_PURLI|nr:pre-mRNA-splicing factor CWC2 [Purpureocillium lilacinum]OAQ77207.1 pre-mRNA-splicing factor CWC2 [Purpureocillium lilacinum]OAQ85778.1 pre-mRNA-splicing factor CWC2 [Purpureocillium lilacinum]